MTVLVFFSAIAAAAPPAGPATIAAAAFAQLPVFSDVELSPDGKSIAYLKPFDGRAHLVAARHIGG